MSNSSRLRIEDSVAGVSLSLSRLRRSLETGDRSQKHPMNELVPSFQKTDGQRRLRGFALSLEKLRSQQSGAQRQIPVFNSVTPATPDLLQLLKNTRF